jgi:hypothetical protein
MAKITAVFPSVIKDDQTGVDNHQQLVEALDTQKNELNFSFQDELKQEVNRFTWFSMRFGC